MIMMVRLRQRCTVLFRFGVAVGILLIPQIIPVMLGYTIMTPCNSYYFRRLDNSRIFQRKTVSVVKLTQKGENIDDSNDGIGVGIDLGTTNSAIAYLHNGTIPTIISIPNNGRTMPSIVSLLYDTTTNSIIPVVGKDALQYATDDSSKNRIYRNVKRIIGTGGKLSSDIISVVPFVKPAKTGKTFKNNNLMNQIDDTTHHPTLLEKQLLPTGNTSLIMSSIYSLPAITDNSDSIDIRPEFISSYIIQKLKLVAEQCTNQTVTRAVIGIPAYFHDAQRNATLAAARWAGIPKVQLLREPEAAALAYGIGRQQVLQKENRIMNMDQDELVLVFDLGGGTYDVSILSVGDDGITEVLCTSGNAQLGGSVWDEKIAKYLYQQLIQVQPSYSSRWEEMKNTVLLCAEAVRIYLSNHRIAHLEFPLWEHDWYAVRNDPSSIIVRNISSLLEPSINTPDGKKNFRSTASRTNTTHLFMQLTRTEMDQLCADELQAILRPLREVAIMSGALLPGDSSPSVVAAALDIEEQSMLKDRQQELLFDDFYPTKTSDDDAGSMSHETNDITADILLTLNRMKENKKIQQRGRKRARDVAKEERKYRQEKKSIRTSDSGMAATQKVSGSTNPTKVRDSISGRPISRIVLVGGVTRMSCIGRLLTAITGVTPQKTVNPDEAVALGCAVQVGRLDGIPGMGTVLTPMQAAIVRAMAISESEKSFIDEDDEFDSGQVY